MNPWKDKLGCEVNVCSAKECDAKRMSFCALRKTYLEAAKRARCSRLSDEAGGAPCGRKVLFECRYYAGHSL